MQKSTSHGNILPDTEAMLVRTLEELLLETKDKLEQAFYDRLTHERNAHLLEQYPWFFGGSPLKVLAKLNFHSLVNKPIYLGYEDQISLISNKQTVTLTPMCATYLHPFNITNVKILPHECVIDFNSEHECLLPEIFDLHMASHNSTLKEQTLASWLYLKLLKSEPYITISQFRYTGQINIQKSIFHHQCSYHTLYQTLKAPETQQRLTISLPSDIALRPCRHFSLHFPINVDSDALNGTDIQKMLHTNLLPLENIYRDNPDTISTHFAQKKYQLKLNNQKNTAINQIFKVTDENHQLIPKSFYKISCNDTSQYQLTLTGHYLLHHVNQAEKSTPSTNQRWLIHSACHDNILLSPSEIKFAKLNFKSISIDAYHLHIFRLYPQIPFKFKSLSYLEGLENLNYQQLTVNEVRTIVPHLKDCAFYDEILNYISNLEPSMNWQKFYQKSLINNLPAIMLPLLKTSSTTLIFFSKISVY